MSAVRRVALFAALAASGCGGGEGVSGSEGDTANTAPGTTGSATSITSASATATGSSTGPTATATGSASGATDSTGDMSTGTGFKLDVGSPDPTTGETQGSEDGCTSVDLLFVIDNSVSMHDYQNSLALAFPEFADTLVESLPPGTSLHVGVTSTTMGHSNSGATINCVATGDNNQPQEAFYETPDQVHNGIEGAQGRLFDPGGGMHYYAIDTDAGPAALNGLKQWFGSAAQIGEGGSQVEMAAAAAGWVADPANADTNAGFVRDEGSVLVLFFLQDEPDQSPWVIDGQSGGNALLAKLAIAKAACGGVECIIGGGFVDTACLDQVPLGIMLKGLGAPSVTAELPDENLAEDYPEQAAEEMNQLLRDTLAGVIGEKCDEIPPPQ